MIDIKCKIWLEDYLLNNGYSMQGEIEAVRIMPWSQVYRILTSKGYIYIKKMAKPFAIESKVITYLARDFQKFIPNIIAANEKLDCFLMTDAGIPLRQYLAKNPQIDVVNQAVSIYATIQRESIKNVNDLLVLGVPDWRLAKLPKLYQDLLTKEDFLQQDGLTAGEIKILKNLVNKFANLNDSIAGNFGYLCITIGLKGDYFYNHPLVFDTNSSAEP